MNEIVPTTRNFHAMRVEREMGEEGTAIETMFARFEHELDFFPLI